MAVKLRKAATQAFSFHKAKTHLKRDFVDLFPQDLYHLITLQCCPKNSNLSSTREFQVSTKLSLKFSKSWPSYVAALPRAAIHPRQQQIAPSLCPADIQVVYRKPDRTAYPMRKSQKPRESPRLCRRQVAMLKTSAASVGSLKSL